jgi:D-alanyl-lipoteichoic acid acyltransferase DltB (MBOAT superfamily)
MSDALFHHYATIAAVCLLAGLAMRMSARLRTPIAVALIGTASLTAIFGTRVCGIYAASLGVFLYVRLAQAFTHGDRKAVRWPLALSGIAIVVLAFLAQSIGIGRLAMLVLGETSEETLSLGNEVQALLSLDMVLSLRLVLFLWEFGAERFAETHLIEYVAWFSLPFTSAGPWLRYSAFQTLRPWESSPPPLTATWWKDSAAAGCMFVAAFGMSRIAAWLESAGGGLGKLLVLYGFAPVGWYLGSAGFFGLMCTTGALGGWAIPINFNAPFVSRNLSEFWSRWNITATEAFRDMLFYNRWGLTSPNLYVNSLIVFLVVGLWHGANEYWILWGLLHGMGFCVFLGWRMWRGAERPLPRGAGWALTYFFVCSCWAAPPQIMKLLTNAAGW